MQHFINFLMSRFILSMLVHNLQFCCLHITPRNNASLIPDDTRTQLQLFQAKKPTQGLHENQWQNRPGKSTGYLIKKNGPFKKRH